MDLDSQEPSPSVKLSAKDMFSAYMAKTEPQDYQNQLYIAKDENAANSVGIRSRMQRIDVLGVQPAWHKSKPTERAASEHRLKSYKDSHPYNAFPFPSMETGINQQVLTAIGIKADHMEPLKRVGK